jgi:hypothetical protein
LNNKLVARLLRRYLPEKLDKLDDFEGLKVLKVCFAGKGVENENFKQENVNNSFHSKENLTQTDQKNDEKHPFHTEGTFRTFKPSVTLLYFFQ